MSKLKEIVNEKFAHLNLSSTHTYCAGDICDVACVVRGHTQFARFKLVNGRLNANVDMTFSPEVLEAAAAVLRGYNAQ